MASTSNGTLGKRPGIGMKRFNRHVAETDLVRPQRRLRQGRVVREAVALLVLILAISLVLPGCVRRGTKPVGEGPGSVEGPGGRSKPLVEDLVPCPLDGEGVPAGSVGFRPIGVVIDNSPLGRPQSGLDEACVVYETLVEGGITRLVAIFLHPSSTPVGPVRSGRDYFLDLVAEYDAILAHAGGSPRFYLELKRSPVRDLDDVRGAEGFHRVKDRMPPYNLYTGIDLLRGTAQRYDISVRQTTADLKVSWEFKGRGGRSDRAAPSASDVTIGYGGFSKYKASYRFDPAKGRYLRFVNGSPHRGSGQLEAGSVIVQFVTVQPVKGDPEGRLRIDTTGEGKGLVFSGGRVTEIVWSKPTRWSPTRFRTKEGLKPELVPGPIWIHLVPVGSDVKWS